MSKSYLYTLIARWHLAQIERKKQMKDPAAKRDVLRHERLADSFFGAAANLDKLGL